MVTNFGYVCTNFNNAGFTRGAIQSLVNSTPTCRIVVVDNASEPESVSALKQIESEFEGVQLILGEENVGYFRGLNIGIRHLRDTDPEVKYMVVGNNDLIFPEDFAAALSCNLASLNGHAVVSPDIITADGVHQNPHVIEAISWPRELIYDLYYSSYALALTIGKLAHLSHRVTDRRDETQWAIPRPIYQGHGSCYILGPLFFDHFEELWAPSFLMGEEFFLSKQLSDKGMRVFYEPGIKVRHHCHASVGRIPGRTMWEIGRDAHRIYREHVGIFGPKAANADPVNVE